MGIDLSKYIFIDHHAHSILKDYLQLDEIAFRQCFSETSSLAVLQTHVATSLPYMHLLKELGQLLGTRNEEELLELRAKQSESYFINKLWDDVSIGSLIIDDGFRTNEMIGLTQLSNLCQRPVFRCLRIESVLGEALVHSSSFAELSNLFCQSLLEVSSHKVVSLKTICAYRGGLELDLVTPAQAQDNFDCAKTECLSKGGRVTKSPLYHYFLLQAFEIASQQNWPVQVHSGIGDDDADLRQSNPLCFRNILHSQSFSKTNFVFLHCYPFVAESAYLSSIYPNVFMDLSLSVNLASPLADNMVLEALSMAPNSKLLAASDGHNIPETHWWGTKCWRRSLQNTLNQLCNSGITSETESYDIAAAVLHENARKLYNLEELI